MKKVLNRASGLTLIEVLVVIAIIALMSTIVGGYYGSVTGSIGLDNMKNSIIYDLRTAQAKAMNGYDSSGDGASDKWGVCFRNPAGDDLYEIVSPTSTCTQASSSTVRTTVYLQSGITFNNLGGDDYELIDFNKISGVPAAATTINIVSGGQSRTITITAAGNIY